MPLKQRLLYLGLDPSDYQTGGRLVHLPLIQIIPYPLSTLENIFKNFSSFTHVLITSKSTIPILLGYLADLGFSLKDWKNKRIVVVGRATARVLCQYNLFPYLIAQNETSEGIVVELKEIPLEGAHLFWPHSALSRPVIRKFLAQKEIKLTECHLYDTRSSHPVSLPSLEQFDAIIFTSPSTVNAFIEIFGRLPENKDLISIGPITEQYLKSKLLK